MIEQFNGLKDAYQRNLFAAEGDQVDIIGLFKQLPELGIKSEYEEDLYHLAARFSDAAAVRFLKANGIKPGTDRYGNTPLHALTGTRFDFVDPKLEEVAEKIYQTAQALLDAGVNPKKKNDSGKLAYFEAGLLYMYPFLQAMGEAGVRMDATESGGMNLLHTICDKLGNRKDIRGAVSAVIKTVRILLEKGSIDIEDKDVFGTTPLTYAQRSGVKEVAALISGDESDVATGGMTIHEAVLNRDGIAVEALIKAGVDLNEISDQYRRTPLMLACEYPSEPLVKLLAEGGADVNFRAGTGETTVYYLLAKSVSNLGRGMSQEIKDIIKMLRILMANGLDLDAAVDNEGNTALNLLCQAGYLADLNTTLAEELIEAGADINKSNQSGKTPLMSFAERGNEMKYNIAELLLDNGADVTSVDKFGNTALIYAAGNSDQMSGKRIVSLIMEKDKSTLERVNNAGQTAMDLAVQQNNEAVVKLLLM
ncbi:ankyrin repeat domain-containing protein [Pedobacter sp. MC2016-14]|uniref:ankyrin repeat domain-containing protein n=1 Tax=Pedobacter sp. MC2016-14 TaxID=2897327 RepID=UPI001E2E471F|nr:ankyrin repeat domain-containing protein [Pedobacter sp. MC2016-14]MCD0490605.1 ankyrin repeat domain-containing protein [Pedobacter sp. MC2016-14]